jgi:hypothetical protein
MKNRTTVLRASRHQDFLAGQHHDPVTRGVFVAGDRVTLCATCLVLFLEESWRAIGGTHCGQLSSVALDNLDSAAATEDDPNPGKHEDRDVQKTIKLIELAPIPFGLNEVPIELR